MLFQVGQLTQNTDGNVEIIMNGEYIEIWKYSLMDILVFVRVRMIL